MSSRRPLLASARSWPAVLVLLAVTACTPIASRAEDDSEVTRLLTVLDLAPTLVVADVGAGEGEWTVPLAETVGEGHVFATEVNEDDLPRIRQHVEDAGLDNVTVLLGTDTDTGLPDACCDVILLRMVYHHFTDPVAMRASLARALRPGGRIAVLDIEPQTNWRELDGVPERGGHGIDVDDLIREMALDGFEPVERLEDWNADEDRFCVVFRHRE